MMDALLAPPSHLRRRLESALQTGSLAPPYRAAAGQAEVGLAAEVDEVAQALRALDADGISGSGCAALPARGRRRYASQRWIGAS